MPNRPKHITAEINLTDNTTLHILNGQKLTILKYSNLPNKETGPNKRAGAQFLNILINGQG